jgi:uncharacterized protein
VKIIALEEHFVTPGMFEAWAAAPTVREDGTTQLGEGALGRRLADVGAQRLRDMDDVGVDVQVLSLNQPGVQNLTPADARTLARDANDAVAAAVASSPDRLEGLAALITPDPPAAVHELQRAVSELGLKGAILNGRTGERNIDHPDFGDIYAAADELRVPIYIHPRLPVVPVREAYYSGFGDQLDELLAGFAVGWHYETGIQLLRLILSGTFDRHPDLQVIVGHWGEMVLFYLERISGMMDQARTGLDRPLAEYFHDNVFYTGSGMLTQHHLQWTIETVGVDRVMFSTDYPFIPLSHGAARTFLEQADLDPADKEKIAHANWERLVWSGVC